MFSCEVVRFIDPINCAVSCIRLEHSYVFKLFNRMWTVVRGAWKARYIVCNRYLLLHLANLMILWTVFLSIFSRSCAHTHTCLLRGLGPWPTAIQVSLLVFPGLPKRLPPVGCISLSLCFDTTIFCSIFL